MLNNANTGAAMKTATVTVGSRVEWDGDLSNASHVGSVLAVSGGMVQIGWANGQVRWVPVGLLFTARWHVR